MGNDIMRQIHEEHDKFWKNEEKMKLGEEIRTKDEHIKRQQKEERWVQ